MKAKEYFNGVSAEAKRVHWPKREEVFKDTAIVIAVCAVSAVFLWAVNTGVLAGVRALIG